MSQSKFIGPISIGLLCLAWIRVAIDGGSDQVVGGLSLLTLIGGLMAFLTLR